MKSITLAVRGALILFGVFFLIAAPATSESEKGPLVGLIPGLTLIILGILDWRRKFVKTIALVIGAVLLAFGVLFLVSILRLKEIQKYPLWFFIPGLILIVLGGCIWFGIVYEWRKKEKTSNLPHNR